VAYQVVVIKEFQLEERRVGAEGDVQEREEDEAL
jgi:hypothetical protein